MPDRAMLYYQRERAVLNSGQNKLQTMLTTKQDKPEKKPKHIHKYMRVSGIHTYIWKCADPHCPHFIHQSQEHYVITRASFCWECGSEFVMTAEAMQEDMPRCDACRHPEILDIDNILNKRLKDV